MPDQINDSEKEKYRLEWVELKNAIEAQKNVEEANLSRKRYEKLKENPLIPIGCLTTAGFLTYGLISLSRGDHKMQQYMMRGRVLAQGFTIVVIAGSLVSTLVMQKSKVN